MQWNIDPSYLGIGDGNGNLKAAGLDQACPLLAYSCKLEEDS